MQDFIEQLNIGRFLKLLKHEPDVARRRNLAELLVAMMAKLQRDEAGLAPINRLATRRQSQDAWPVSAADRGERAAPHR
jgi:hypothetical protein